MKAKTFKLGSEVVVVMEDNNKVVEVYGKNLVKPFTSFKAALSWVEKEDINGVRNMGYN
jgi:hypothetical protein